MHSGEKPFSCDYGDCDARFAQKSALTEHYRSHTGEKPYQCPICDYRSARSGAIRRHVWNLHQDYVEQYQTNRKEDDPLEPVLFRHVKDVEKEKAEQLQKQTGIQISGEIDKSLKDVKKATKLESISEENKTSDKKVEKVVKKSDSKFTSPIKKPKKRVQDKRAKNFAKKIRKDIQESQNVPVIPGLDSSTLPKAKLFGTFGMVDVQKVNATKISPKISKKVQSPIQFQKGSPHRKIINISPISNANGSISTNGMVVTKIEMNDNSNSSTSSNNSLAMLARGIGICASNENSLSGLNLTASFDEGGYLPLNGHQSRSQSTIHNSGNNHSNNSGNSSQNNNNSSQHILIQANNSGNSGVGGTANIQQIYNTSQNFSSIQQNTPANTNIYGNLSSTNQIHLIKTSTNTLATLNNNLDIGRTNNNINGSNNIMTCTTPTQFSANTPTRQILANTNSITNHSVMVTQPQLLQSKCSKFIFGIF